MCSFYLPTTSTSSVRADPHPRATQALWSQTRRQRSPCTRGSDVPPRITPIIPVGTCLLAQLRPSRTFPHTEEGQQQQIPIPWAYDVMKCYVSYEYCQVAEAWRGARKSGAGRLTTHRYQIFEKRTCSLWPTPTCRGRPSILVGPPKIPGSDG